MGFTHLRKTSTRVLAIIVVVGSGVFAAVSHAAAQDSTTFDSDVNFTYWDSSPTVLDPVITVNGSQCSTDLTAESPKRGWCHVLNRPGFGSSGVIGAFDYYGPWTYTSSVWTRAVFTDVLCPGDQYELYDNGTSVGTTSAPPFSGCGTFAHPDLTHFLGGDPDVALTNPDASHGFFCLPPGAHSLQWKWLAVASGQTVNSSAFKVTTDLTGCDTPPVVTVPSDISTGPTDATGAPVSFAATASDLEDGALTPVCTPASGSHFGFGTTSVSCVATDSGGLTDTKTFKVTVNAFGWIGFYQPVDNLPVNNTSKGGSTIPVKFNVYGSGNQAISDTNAITSITPVPVACSTTGIADAIETTVLGGTSLRWDGSQFIFNWKTPKQMHPTCWRLDVTLQDNSVHSANFTLF